MVAKFDRIAEEKFRESGLVSLSLFLFYFDLKIDDEEICECIGVFLFESVKVVSFDNGVKVCVCVFVDLHRLQIIGVCI